LLAYRHSFHAGNFADVLKHIVLVEMLQYLKRKDGAFDYVDTHAGAGLYDLRSAHAEKLGEYRQGIGRLVSSASPLLRSYLDVVAAFNPGEELVVYPGSPAIALHLMRPQDRASLFELHPSDHALLEEQVKRDRRVQLIKQDGFAGLAGLLPPRSRRGLVLVDPSYEIKTDYARVVSTLAKAHKRFATGSYAIWYPVLERSHCERFIGQIRDSGIRDIQRFELAVRQDSPWSGMSAAGMLVINPPFTLMQTLSGLLPQLVEALGQDSGAAWRAEVLVAE
jgi:23S rRNA (adenine2030-N6)-methyltransferase